MMIDQLRKCEICGKQYTPKSTTQKYCCASCAREAEKAQSRIRNLKSPQRKARKRKKEELKKKRPSLMDEYAKAVKEGAHEGLSYGYWVAKRYKEQNINIAI